MSFKDRVEECFSSLTQSDILIVTELKSHPVDAALWKGEDVARRVGVHPSAATRLAQRLGYRGYLELREDLRVDREALLTGSGAGDRFRNELEEVGDATILESLLSAEVDSLSALRKHVQQSQIDQVADALARAKRVHVYARGNAGVLAELMVRRMRRFGIPTTELSGDTRDLAEKTLQIARGDVVVVFAFRKAPATLPTLLKSVRGAEATTVLVTDTLHMLTPTPDLVLSAPRGTTDGFASLTVPMAVTNAVVLTMAARHAHTVLPALDRLDSLINSFEE